MTTGNPDGLPKSDKLTVRGRDRDACGPRVSLSKVVKRVDRRYCAIIWSAVCSAGGMGSESYRLRSWSDFPEDECVEGVEARPSPLE